MASRCRHTKTMRTCLSSSLWRVTTPWSLMRATGLWLALWAGFRSSTDHPALSTGTTSRAPQTSRGRARGR